jgi:hypothetical protein
MASEGDTLGEGELGRCSGDGTVLVGCVVDVSDSYEPSAILWYVARARSPDFRDQGSRSAALTETCCVSVAVQVGEREQLCS